MILEANKRLKIKSKKMNKSIRPKGGGGGGMGGGGGITKKYV